MKPVRITQLEIHNIGPFGNAVLDFPEKPAGMEGKAEIHILTGENGTGKTTVLELMAEMVADSVGRINKPKNYFAIGPKFRFKNEQSYVVLQFEPFGKASIGFNHGVLSSTEINYNIFDRISVAGLSAVFFAYSGYRRVNQVSINGIQEISTNPLESALDFQSSINPQLILQWIANTIAAEAIAQSQGNSIDAKNYRDAINRLENAITSIIDKTIHFQLNTKPYEVSIKVDNENLNFNLLPDGLKSIISWIADLLMRMDRIKWVDDTPVLDRNFILFLDEIEVHMHPAWQRRILPAVQSLFPNAQIFISTHSPFVVGSVDGAWIHKLVKPNGDATRSELILSEDARSYRYWLDEVFDIKAQYGPGVEKDIAFFYELRNRVLQQENGITVDQLLHSGRQLAIQSDELNQIIEMEIRQINRRTGLQLSL